MFTRIRVLAAASAAARGQKSQIGAITVTPNRAAAQERPEKASRHPARRLRRIVALTAGSIALTAGAIPAVAAVTTSPEVYYACVTNTTGAIKVVSATATCATNQYKISWNNQGPPGPPGVATGYASFNSNSVQLGAGFANDSLGGSLSLPGGTFLVNVSAYPLAYLTASDDVTCALWDGNNGFPLDTADVTLFPSPNNYTDGSIAMTVATTVGGQMKVMCWDRTAQAYVANVSITAIPLSTIQASGLAHLSKRSGHHALLPPRTSIPAARSRGVSSAGRH